MRRSAESEQREYIPLAVRATCPYRAFERRFAVNTLHSAVHRSFSKSRLIMILLVTILPGSAVGESLSVSVLPTRISLPEHREADGLWTTVRQGSVLPEQRQAASTALGRVFTPEVQRWAPAISAWAQQYAIEANLIGTLMQIESCGDSQTVSPIGAQGLFQVMPFHFQASEDKTDPDTNARRGLEYLKEVLKGSDNSSAAILPSSSSLIVKG